MVTLYLESITRTHTRSRVVEISPALAALYPVIYVPGQAAIPQMDAMLMTLAFCDCFSASLHSSNAAIVATLLIAKTASWDASVSPFFITCAAMQECESSSVVNKKQYLPIVSWTVVDQEIQLATKKLKSAAYRLACGSR